MAAAPEPLVMAVSAAVLDTVQRCTALAAGGPCAALEEPPALVQDSRALYRERR